jgi:hypothetical protein
MESQPPVKSAENSKNADIEKSAGLFERRFIAEWNRLDWVALGAAVVSGVLLGAGSYAAQAMDPPADYRNFLFLGGVVAAALFAFRISSGKSVVCVGDAGVAVEQRGENTRLLWSEVTSIRYEEQQLVLAGVNATLRLPSQRHARAIRAVLAEAARRLPRILDVSKKIVDSLPAVTGGGPKVEPVASLQIAGKRCLVTKEILTFERDARLCPNCTSVYHRDHVPSTCVTCERPLGDAALSVGQ